MRNLKRIIAAMMMTTVLLIGSTFANDGIIILGAKTDGNTRNTTPTQTRPCTQKSKTGIIVTDLAGIIILGFTGIIVTDFTSCTPSDTKSAETGIIILG
jgi:hypothetical protein